jgi:hypothetical protein
VPTQPFSMATLPPLGSPNERLGNALKQLSAAKYGLPRATVEKDIFARMKTKETPAPAFSPAAGSNRSPFAGPTAPSSGLGGPVASSVGGPAKLASSPVPGSGSFIDDWLSKRRTTPTTPAANNPFSPPAAPIVSPPTPAPTVQPSTNGSAFSNSVSSTVPQLTTQTLNQPQTPEPPVTGTNNAVEEVLPTEANVASPLIQANQASVEDSTTSELVDEDQNHNISSDEAEQQEIDKIAAELRGQLKRSQKSDGVTHIDHSNVSATTAAETEEPNEDTIYIDREGTLHVGGDTSSNVKDTETSQKTTSSSSS